MSRHLYPATHQGEPVSVLIGYDRRLSGFFLVIEKAAPSPDIADLPTEDDEDDPYLYSNLADMELIEWGGLPPTLDHFLRKMQELNIPALPSVIAEVRADQANNTGNRTVRYDAAGAVLAKS